MKKIIFLDIDGTLNRWCFTKEKIPGHAAIGLDPENFACFLNMLEKTDAKIVLCSVWRQYESHRNFFKDSLGPRFQDRLIGFTHRIYSYDGKSNDCRHKEIELWLKENPDTTHWVVLDDDGYVVNSDIGKGIKPFIRSLEGFNEEHVPEVLSFLTD